MAGWVDLHDLKDPSQPNPFCHSMKDCVLQRKMQTGYLAIDSRVKVNISHFFPSCHNLASSTAQKRWELESWLKLGKTMVWDTEDSAVKTGGRAILAQWVLNPSQLSTTAKRIGGTVTWTQLKGG